jgi:hypothetical protein
VNGSQQAIPNSALRRQSLAKEVVRPLGLEPIQETQVCAYMIARLDAG